MVESYYVDDVLRTELGPKAKLITLSQSWKEKKQIKRGWRGWYAMCEKTNGEYVEDISIYVARRWRPGWEAQAETGSGCRSRKRTRVEEFWWTWNIGTMCEVNQHKHIGGSGKQKVSSWLGDGDVGLISKMYDAVI